MTKDKSPRSWRQAFADFVRALDDMENRLPNDVLWARVIRLEALLAELAASDRSEWSGKIQKLTEPGVSADRHANAVSNDR